ncbi:MAG: PA14 domain-containing protein, partial [Actinomycetes bacterium]
GLTAEAGENKITLAWQAVAADDLALYRVYRSTTTDVDTTGTPLATVPAGTTGYVDATAVGGTSYTYKVVAVDTSANASAPSGAVTATAVQAPAPKPAAPTQVGARVEGEAVVVTWTASSSPSAVGYEVLRGGSVVSGSAPVDGTTFRDMGTTAGSSYAYTVVAVDALEQRSAPSETAQVSVPEATCAAGQYKAEYFDGIGLAGQAVSSGCEDAVDHDFGEGKPKGVANADSFSARYTTTRQLGAGEHTFTVTADDGVRVFVDGVRLINEWAMQGATTFTAKRELAAGSHTVVVEYFEAGGSALVRFGMSGPPVTPEPPVCTDDQYVAQYFSGVTLDGTPVATRCESAIDYDFGAGAPAGVAVGKDNFSIRWTRSAVLEAGTYAVTATADDGVRVLVDGHAVVDQWKDQGPTTYTGSVNLAAGKHEIVVEYYERGGGALVRADIQRTAGTSGPADAWTYSAWNNTSLSGAAAVTGCETAIDHDYGMGKPEGIADADRFSLRWSKHVELAAGDYVFNAAADDGVRVLVDGHAVLDEWRDQGVTAFTATVPLSAGAHDIAVEYYESGGGSLVRASFAKAEGPTDTTAPVAPAGLVATPATNAVDLAWTANTEADLAGYAVYRGPSAPVDTTGTPLSGTTLLTTPVFSDTTAAVGTTYVYAVVAVDSAGNRSGAATSAPVGPKAPEAPKVERKLNFQPTDAPVPSGFQKETGAAWTDAAGQGWVRQDSLSSGTHVPVDLTGNTRDRNRSGIAQELDTVLHMQYGDIVPTPTGNGNLTLGAFELAVPNGSYVVEASVGDQPGGAKTGCSAPCYDSKHTVRAEGVKLLDQFQATASTEYKSGSARVDVTDGRLTIDAIGGNNTKLNWLTVVTAGPDTQAPAAPAKPAAVVGNDSVSLSWAASSEADLAGYRVYRSTTASVDVTGTPLNTVLLTTPAFTDTTVTNGTAYTYAVVAVDKSGNASPASATVTATPMAVAGFSTKVNFADAETVPPVGYVTDYGRAFGPRTSANQGTGNVYGWVQLGTSTPVSLEGNGRNRNTGSPSANQPDLRLATMMHMQLPSNATNGVSTPGSWEMAVPNGAYQVTVAVGDAGTAVDSTHWINIENQNAIAAFVPTSSKFATATRTVVVDDGRLTLSPAGGINTKVDYVDVQGVELNGRPYATVVQPTNGAVGVVANSSVTTDTSRNNVNGAVDPTSLSGVKLTRVSDGASVAGRGMTSGGADTVAFQADAVLQANTLYRFDITPTVKDVSGRSFLPFSSVFTTGTSGGGEQPPGGEVKAAFEKAAASGASNGKSYTSVVVGPDGKLYAGSILGQIYRWTINPDGTLSNEQVINTVRDHASAKGWEGAPNRTVIGLAFDPASSPSNPTLWITDNYAYLGSAVPDMTGAIAKLTGPNLENYQEVVVNLPRSIKDHETNSLAFKDGKIYVVQGSMNAMGASEGTWKREEHLLSAAMLELDPAKLPANLPVDAGTPDMQIPARGGVPAHQGTYDPYAPGAPLTLYATGIRNAYDLVWHSNGHLYTGVNGSAAGGSTPATPSPYPAVCANRPDGGYTGPSAPAIIGNSQAETDYIFDVHKGKYYGHPNPMRCEYVLNAGNP